MINRIRTMKIVPKRQQENENDQDEKDKKKVDPFKKKDKKP